MILINWKTCRFNQILLSILCHQKKNCVCIKRTHLASKHGGNDIEAIKYNVKKWINEKDLKKALGYKHLAGSKTQCYSSEFKKRGYEIQGCEDFHPCRKFIAE